MHEIIMLETMEDAKAFVQNAYHPIVLMMDPDDVSFCGHVIGDVFGYRMGIETPNIRDVIRDFIDYESLHNRTPLVFMLKGTSFPAPSPADAGSQPQNDWVVHSTDVQAGEGVLTSGFLYSRRRLEEDNVTFRNFGRAAIGEPTDYSDLVNFATIDGYGPEIVVASKEHGRFCSEGDSYCPGARFYFRVGSLQQQPGYTRFMGGHAVRDSLPLDQVNHCVVTVTDVAQRPSWTPKAFTEVANKAFKQRIAEE